MNEMKGECKKNRCNPSGTLFFIIGLIFIDLFGFNPERMENSQVTKNLVLPYISLNITSTMFVLSIAASAICFIGSKSKWKVPSNVLTLVARMPATLILQWIWLSGKKNWVISMCSYLERIISL